MIITSSTSPDHPGSNSGGPGALCPSHTLKLNLSLTFLKIVSIKSTGLGTLTSVLVQGLLLDRSVDLPSLYHNIFWFIPFMGLNRYMSNMTSVFLKIRVYKIFHCLFQAYLVIHLPEWFEYQIQGGTEFSSVKLSLTPIFYKWFPLFSGKLFWPFDLYSFTWLPLYSEKPAMFQCNRADMENTTVACGKEWIKQGVIDIFPHP